jgi:hypothetical protein
MQDTERAKSRSGLEKLKEGNINPATRKLIDGKQIFPAS